MQKNISQDSRNGASPNKHGNLQTYICAVGYMTGFLYFCTPKLSKFLVFLGFKQVSGVQGRKKCSLYPGKMKKWGTDETFLLSVPLFAFWQSEKAGKIDARRVQKHKKESLYPARINPLYFF